MNIYSTERGFKMSLTVVLSEKGRADSLKQGRPAARLLNLGLEPRHTDLVVALGGGVDVYGALRLNSEGFDIVRAGDIKYSAVFDEPPENTDDALETLRQRYLDEEAKYLVRRAEAIAKQRRLDNLAEEYLGKWSPEQVAGSDKAEDELDRILFYGRHSEPAINERLKKLLDSAREIKQGRRVAERKEELEAQRTHTLQWIDEHVTDDPTVRERYEAGVLPESELTEFAEFVLFSELDENFKKHPISNVYPCSCGAVEVAQLRDTEENPKLSAKQWEQHKALLQCVPDNACVTTLCNEYKCSSCGDVMHVTLDTVELDSGLFIDGTTIILSFMYVLGER